MYIRSFHLQPQISKIFTGLHTVYTFAQEACTQGFCVSLWDLKLTHLATASRIMREVHWQNKTGWDLQDVQLYQGWCWRWHHIGNLEYPVLRIQRTSSEKTKSKKRKRKKWIKYEQFHIGNSETTCRRCNSMYNIWHCVYTFPYQQIWNMSILILVTGTETITKHPGCSINTHTIYKEK